LFKQLISITGIKKWKSEKLEFIAKETIT